VLNIEPSVLVCPTKGKSTLNGYVYNMKWANKSLGEITNSAQALLFADGVQVTTGLAPVNSNLLIAFNDVNLRHSNNYVAAFADGHVSVSNKTLTAPDDLYAPGPLVWVSGLGITTHPAPCATLKATAQGWDSWVGGNTPNGLVDGVANASTNVWTWGYQATPTWVQIDLGSIQKVGAVRFWGSVMTFGSTRTTKDADIYVDNTPQANNSAWVSHGSALQTATNIPNNPDGAPSNLYYLITVPEGRYVTIACKAKYDTIYVGFGEVGVAIVP
jgi:prepilin-type processing-associated H-X9-DG protein